VARSRSQRIIVRRVDGETSRRAPDEVAVEEPLEIRLDGHVVTTTMRTPGDDHELAVGFLHAEGSLADARVQGVRSCGLGLDPRAAFNVVDVSSGGAAPPPVARLATTTSACGVCGAAAVDDLIARLDPIAAPPPIPVPTLLAVVEAVRGNQALFDATGGVHAAAAFTVAGEIVLVREDVGRHNAVDKVVGRLRLDDRLPAADLGLYVSGRAGFEIVQKAWAAGFGTVVAVGAPTSLAVDVARQAGLVLAAFLRPGGLNVYAPAP